MHVVLCCFAVLAGLASAAVDKKDTVYQFTVKDIDGNDVDMSRYEGKVLLIVNVASNCGLAPSQYPQLQALQAKYYDAGLRVLAFPSNQFHQEFETAKEIKDYVSKLGVTFDMFQTVYINGDEASPLYKFLKEKQSGTLFDAIKWNFTKFLVDRQGRPVERYAPTTSPSSMAKDIEKFLAQKV